MRLQRVNGGGPSSTQSRLTLWTPCTGTLRSAKYLPVETPWALGVRSAQRRVLGGVETHAKREPGRRPAKASQRADVVGERPHVAGFFRKDARVPGGHGLPGNTGDEQAIEVGQLRVLARRAEWIHEEVCGQHL